MSTLKKIEEEIKTINLDIEEQPEGETKEVLKSMLKNYLDLKSLIEQYEAIPKEERENLPESLREFFCDKVA